VQPTDSGAARRGPKEGPNRGPWPARRFAFRDEERRASIIAAAGHEEWCWLCAHASIAAILDNARDIARRRRIDTASRFYRSLIRCASRDAFPGGAQGWLEVVVDAVRAFRAVDWLETVLLDEAVALAVTKGDLKLVAVLSAACGFAAGCAGRFDDSRAYMDRALEAAEATGDRAICFEVNVRIAYLHTIQGRPRECIAAFERFLGDIPEEIVPLPWAPAFDPTPEAPLSILAVIYDQIGQHGRALDLLHRLMRAGSRLNRPDLLAIARSSLAVIHSGRRELEARAPTRTGLRVLLPGGL
jgi:tetratricopeptide (TPR) repeat protein